MPRKSAVINVLIELEAQGREGDNGSNDSYREALAVERKVEAGYQDDDVEGNNPPFGEMPVHRRALLAKELEWAETRFQVSSKKSPAINPPPDHRGRCLVSSTRINTFLMGHPP